MRKIICLSVDVEEWFDSKWFNPEALIEKYYDGERPKTDVKENVERLLDIFEEHSVASTFFVLGRVAQEHPESIKHIWKRGHEIASHGFNHENASNILKFRDDFRKSIQVLKCCSGSKIYGYRSPNADINLGKLDIIAAEEMIYDSSVFPCIKIPRWYGNVHSPVHPYLMRFENRFLCELPLPVFPYFRVPFGGGWYLRNLGSKFVRIGLRFLLRKSNCAMLYVHPWEISQENPLHREIPRHVFRNTGTYVEEALESLIREFSHCHFLSAVTFVRENSAKLKAYDFTETFRHGNVP